MVYLTGDYFDEVHDKKQAATVQSQLTRKYCEHCKSRAGHEMDCPEVTIESINHLLRQARSNQKHAKDQAARYLNDLQRLTGKMAILKQENNKLRANNRKLTQQLKDEA